MSENSARDFSRRSFLKGTAAGAVAASLGSATSFAWMAPAAAAELPPTPPHGAELRGMDLVVQSPTTEGRFGFMFKSQPPLAASDTLLDRLGATMEEQPAANPASSSAAKDENDALNENPNLLLTSGFTFLGQFVDHDITFDTTTLDLQQSDPDATKNFRTPRYDLDAIYGLGPGANPQFYDPDDRDKFLIRSDDYTEITGKLKRPDGVDETKTWDVLPDTVWDVPRTGDPENADDPPKGTAIMADPRNDQTLIILQLHVAMQKFHNRLVEVLRMQGVPRSAVFESARRMARWHYQWIVTHQFLPAIVGSTMMGSIYQETSKGAKVTLKYYKPTNPAGRSFIPVEFAVAAYRFGHSITRPRYTVRDVYNTAGTTVLGSVSGVPLFQEAPSENNLNGHRDLLPVPRLKLQWSKFFNETGKYTARPVRQFDASLADPLFKMPTTALPDSNELGLLSQRNLRRGRKMNLPSGQQVAKLMGVTPLTNAQLSWNHRIPVHIPIVGNKVAVKTPPGEYDEENQSLKTELADPGWKGEAPLWFYILKEAELVGKGRTLGPVGGRIVAEVLVGLLQKDPNSYLYLQPNWKPAPPIAPTSGQFTMADLLKFAGVWA